MVQTHWESTSNGSRIAGWGAPRRPSAEPLGGKTEGRLNLLSLEIKQFEPLKHFSANICVGREKAEGWMNHLSLGIK
ncbi:MAG: hypothetical protein K2N13_02920 [Paraprevotella sp.]|nr:hypothetical protein [Paraprevotella sp.]